MSNLKERLNMNLKELLNDKIKRGEKIFVPYIMVGEVSLEKSYDEILFLESCGAAVIELGVPFSDPTSDGKVIQESGIRALENQINLEKIFKLVEKVRESSDIPLVIMSYLNPIYKYGLEEFFKDCRNFGVQGIILPDLRMEEFSLIEEYIRKYNVDYIPLYSPTTPLERLKALCEVGNGFLYVVTSLGVTGEKKLNKAALGDTLQEIRNHSTLPMMAGFGISTKEDIEGIIHYCDGVIIGSRIIKLFRNDDYEGIKSLTEGFRK